MKNFKYNSKELTEDIVTPEVEFNVVDRSNDENVYFMMEGMVLPPSDPEWRDYFLPSETVPFKKSYSVYDTSTEAFISTPSKVKSVIDKKLTKMKRQQFSPEVCRSLLVWKIDSTSELGVYEEVDDDEVFICSEDEPGFVCGAFEFYPDNTSELVYNGILSVKESSNWIDNAFEKGFNVDDSGHITWDTSTTESLDEIEFTQIDKHQLTEEEFEELYDRFYDDVFFGVEYLTDLGYDTSFFYNVIDEYNEDPDFDPYSGDLDYLDLFYELLEELDLMEIWDFYLHKSEDPRAFSDDEVNSDGYIFEDVEIEFSDLPEPTYTNITNDVKAKLEAAGYTDIHIKPEIFEEKSSSVWYYPFTYVLYATYNNRYEVCVSVGDFNFWDTNTEDYVEFTDLEHYGIVDDSTLYELAAYYENDEAENCPLNFEIYPTFRISTRDKESANDYSYIDEDYWWEDSETIPDLIYDLTHTVPEIVEEYEAEIERRNDLHKAMTSDESEEPEETIEEDVDIELTQIDNPYYMLTNINKEIIKVLESYGLTDIKLSTDFFAERQDSNWYTDEIASGVYKNKYRISLYSFDDMYGTVVSDNSTFSTIEDLENLGVWTDEDLSDAEYNTLSFSSYNVFALTGEIIETGERLYFLDDYECVYRLDSLISQLEYLEEDIDNFEKELELNEGKKKDNILKRWQKHNKKTDKKGSRGWFVGLCSGNIEQNISRFNAANNAAEAPSTNPTGPMGESFNVDLEEEVVVHDELNPKLWENNKLKQEVIDKINLITNTFIESLKEDGVEFELDDVVIVGSNCSYNYNDASDLDVHLRMKTDSLKCEPEMYTLLYGAYRNLFNNKFDIDFYGIDVELYVEDESSTVNSNGIYSVMKNEWIKEPERTSIPEINKEELETELSKWKEEYFNIKEQTTEGDSEEHYLNMVDVITDFIEDIYELRKLSIASDGEYAIGNLVFKEFRGEGLLDEAKELKSEMLSKAMSLTKDTLKEALDLRSIDSIEKLKALKGLVDEDGTYSIEDGKLVKKNLDSGYMVSFFRPEITNKDFVRCREIIGKSLGEPYYGIYGGDPEVSFCVDSKNFAMSIAKAFNQVSIWDNAAGDNGEIINPNYNEIKKVDYLEATKNLRHLLGKQNTKKEKK